MGNFKEYLSISKGQHILADWCQSDHREWYVGTILSGERLTGAGGLSTKTEDRSTEDRCSLKTEDAEDRREEDRLREVETHHCHS